MNDITTVTEKGQITIPSGIRKRLGIQPRDKVRFTVEDGTVRLTPVSVTLEAAFGAVPPLSVPQDIEDQVRAAKDDRGGRLIEKMRRN